MYRKADMRRGESVLWKKVSYIILWRVWIVPILLHPEKI